jgi:pyruvate ferredoxin oxidoreductase beta subunit
MNPAETIEVAKLAVDTHIFPLYEIDQGKIHVTRKGKGVPVVEYLKLQGRFSHLTEAEVDSIQTAVDARYKLLLDKEASGT